MAIRRPPTTFSDTISTTDIADDAISGDKLANDIAISTTGNITTTGSGALTVAGNTTLSGTNNLGSNPTVTLASNTTVNIQEYCSVRISALQTVAHATYVAIDFDTTEYDPNNWFNTSTYKFQPTKGGKYFVALNLHIYSHQGTGNNEISRAFIKKNATDANSTSVVTMATVDTRSSGRGYNFAVNSTAIVDMNGSSDYLYNMVYFVDYEGNSTGRIDHNLAQFAAFRIGS